jgi:hypothetical protein
MEKKGRSVSAEAVSIQKSLHQMLDAAPKVIVAARTNSAIYDRN